MKVGILTFHKSHNYGAFLQAYALTMYLKDIGLDAEIIDFNMKISEEQYKVRNKNPIVRYHMKKRYYMFKKSFDVLPMSKMKCVSNEINDFKAFVKNKYQLIIAGSDEIWRIDSTRGFPNPYWLVGDLGSDKISYAASSRSDFSKISDEQKEFIIKALDDFKVIGIRDRYSFEEISKIIKEDTNNVKMCCDPTFLYDFDISIEKGKKILYTKKGIDKSKKTLLIMSNDTNMAKFVRKRYSKKFNLVSVYNYYSGYVNLLDINPFEWVNMIATADIVITNYFHGLCFALKCNSQFIAIDSREKVTKNGKIYDLLQRENLLDHFLTTKDKEYLIKLDHLCQKLVNDINPDFTLNVKHQREISSNIINIIANYSNRKKENI